MPRQTGVVTDDADAGLDQTNAHGFICSGCGHRSPASAQFCSACGARLESGSRRLHITGANPDDVVKVMREAERQRLASQGPWRAGLFYLTSIVVITTILLVVARSLPVWTLPIVLAAAVVTLVVLGALQQRQHGKITEKGLISLIGRRCVRQSCSFRDATPAARKDRDGPQKLGGGSQPCLVHGTTCGLVKADRSGRGPLVINRLGIWCGRPARARRAEGPERDAPSRHGRAALARRLDVSGANSAVGAAYRAGLSSAST
jgi:hypothetical protein